MYIFQYSVTAELNDDRIIRLDTQTNGLLDPHAKVSPTAGKKLVQGKSFLHLSWSVVNQVCLCVK